MYGRCKQPLVGREFGTDTKNGCKGDYIELSVKPEECFCCSEIDRCCKKMDGIDNSCITQHPGFRNVCLDSWVLETAAIGLKTKQNKSYTVLFNQGMKTEAE